MCVDTKGNQATVCVCCSASTICDNSHPGDGILWGTSRKLHLALISLHPPRACWAAHFLTDSPPARCSWHSYSTTHCMAPKCYSSPVFEKPFHFSLLSGTRSNGLLSLHKVPSVIHVQPNTRWPSATSDSGCNYDGPNALLNCTAGLLLARQSLALCCIRTVGFALFYPFRIEFKIWHQCEPKGRNGTLMVVKSEIQPHTIPLWLPTRM